MPTPPTPLKDLTPQVTPRKLAISATRRSTRGNSNNTSTDDIVPDGDDQGRKSEAAAETTETATDAVTEATTATTVVDTPQKQQSTPQEKIIVDTIRGTRDPESEVPIALNSPLYAMLRINRGLRRSFLNGLLNLFDDMQVRLWSFNSVCSKSCDFDVYRFVVICIP